MSKQEISQEISQQIVEWAKIHGSWRVQTGLKWGYDMFPSIVHEWVAAHYPGATADIKDSARWELSKDPSERALQMLCQFMEDPNVDSVIIVEAKEWPILGEDGRLFYLQGLCECAVVRDIRLPSIDLVIPVGTP